MSAHYRLKVVTEGESAVLAFETPVLGVFAWNSYSHPVNTPMGSVYKILEAASNKNETVSLSLLSDEAGSDVWEMETPPVLNSQETNPPRYLVNTTKSEYVDLWLTIEHSSSKGGYIDPLAMLISQGSEKDQGVWLADELYLSDKPPSGYDEFFVSFLMGEAAPQFQYEIIEEIRETPPLWLKTLGHYQSAPLEVFQNLHRALYTKHHGFTSEQELESFSINILNWVEAHYIVVPIYSNGDGFSLSEKDEFTGYACLSKEVAKTRYGVVHFSKQLEERCLERLSLELNQDTPQEVIYAIKVSDRKGRELRTYQDGSIIGADFRDRKELEELIGKKKEGASGICFWQHKV